MNPLYTILESPHRWLILAGISFTVGFFGAIMMIAYTWPHTASRIWFYAGTIAALYFLARAFWDWKQRAEAAIQAETANPDDSNRAQSTAATATSETSTRQHV